MYIPAENLLKKQMPIDPDAELMLLVKDGNKKAFQALFNKYKNRVLNFCYRFCGHQEISEELTQEVFLRVYKAAPRYRAKSRFTTWLFKIATNVCLNEIRKREYRQRIESTDQISADSINYAAANQSIPSPEKHLQMKEHSRSIKKALGELSSKQRAAIILRVEEGFRYKEIARQINCSENHVRVLIYRGRQQLKKNLTNYLGESG